MSPYNAAGNSKIERVHRDLASSIRATINSDLKWTKLLHLIQLALNTSVCSTKKFSSYYLMFYRIPPITRCQLHPISGTIPSEDEHIRELADRFKKAFKIVEANTERRLEYRELTYGEASKLKEGDRVLVYIPRRTKGVSSKLLPAYSLPFRVKKELSWSVYRVESEDWARKKIVLDRSATFLKNTKTKTQLTTREPQNIPIKILNTTPTSSKKYTTIRSQHTTATCGTQPVRATRLRRPRADGRSDPAN